jgi:DNA-binding NtrC family response regulator
MRPSLNAVACAIHTLLDSEREARRLGAQDYLNKPLNFDDMLVRITRALSLPPA